MDELLAQFLIEGPELVQQGGEALMALERAPGDRSLTDDAFRAIHTLKGSVGLFDLPAMATALHAAEDVLSAVRSGLRTADPATIDALLGVLTQTERWLNALHVSAALPDDAMAIARRLADQLTDRAAPAGDGDGTDIPDWALRLRQALPNEVAGLVAIRYRPAAGSYFSGDDPMALMAAVPGLRRLALATTPAKADEPYDPYDCRLVLHALAQASVAEVRAVFRFIPDQVELAALPAALKTAAAAEVEHQAARTLRVEAERVEKLAVMVDELVAAKTALAALANLAISGVDAAAVARGLAVQSEAVDRLVGQMHQQVMALRMIPVGPMLRRFPRVVRELAKTLGKEIDVVVQDNGVEADKTIIEGLFEPLTHLLRNAVDHGVEAAEDRAALGKPRKAHISLTAEVASGRFILTVGDDGKGIDAAAIRAAVLAKGLLDAEQLAQKSDKEAVELIFLPGFSTARAVSDVSGRGVGMDAVKTAVQRLGGRLAVRSSPGQGTAIELSLPLSLSLTKVMVVVSEGESYGVPLDRVLETVRVPASAITPIRAGQAFNWRDRTAPLLALATLVGGAEPPAETDRKVMVVRAGAEVIGISVDAIEDRTDVAVRPLDGLLAGMPGISGTTLLGDGRVLMIVDPEVLVG